MSQHKNGEGSGTLAPEVLEELDRSGLGSAIDDALREASAAYGEAMLWGQVLEQSLRMAGPALSEALGTDEWQEIADRGQRRNMHRAIEALESSVGQELPLRLLDELREAKDKRNWLAHEFWWARFAGLVGGRTEEVVGELRACAEEFQSLIRDLLALALRPSVARRGVDPEVFDGAMDAFAAALVFQPDEVAPEGEDHLLVDGPAMVERIASLLERAAAAAEEAGPPGD